MKEKVLSLALARGNKKSPRPCRGLFYFKSLFLPRARTI